MTAIKEKESIDFKALRYVEVRWMDANANNAWVSIHGDTDVDAAPCISRGWVMKDDETQIMLCGTVAMDKDGLVSEANNTMAIPRGMVQSVVDFPGKKRRKQKAPLPLPEHWTKA